MTLEARSALLTALDHVGRYLAILGIEAKYSPDQERDEQGRWVGEGGSSKPTTAKITKALISAGRTKAKPLGKIGLENESGFITPDGQALEITTRSQQGHDEWARAAHREIHGGKNKLKEDEGIDWAMSHGFVRYGTWRGELNVQFQHLSRPLRGEFRAYLSRNPDLKVYGDVYGARGQTTRVISSRAEFADYLGGVEKRTSLKSGEAKYSPDQARDEAGRFTSGGGSGTGGKETLHGTSARYLGSILKKGLTPQKLHNFEDGYYQRGGRGESVYVSVDSERAYFYMVDAVKHLQESKGIKADGIVLHIRIPKDVSRTRDELDETSYRLSKVSREWIVGYDLYKHNEISEEEVVKPEYHALKSAEDFDLLYVGIAVWDPDTPLLLDAAKYSPDQARDEQGRFTSGGGSASASEGRSSRWLSPGKRVWQGEQHAESTSLSKLETGALGEAAGRAAMGEYLGVPVSTLNVGLNNAPADAAADHAVLEIKTGIASNGPSAQQWRVTLGEPGKEEKAQLAKMNADEKREWNAAKMEAALQRKEALLKRLSAKAGKPIRAYTIGTILSPDGKQADVFLFSGFHTRIGWSQATEDKYLGTFPTGKK